jgi:hypothetical protein
MPRRSVGKEFRAMPLVRASPEGQRPNQGRSPLFFIQASRRGIAPPHISRRSRHERHVRLEMSTVVSDAPKISKEKALSPERAKEIVAPLLVLSAPPGLKSLLGSDPGAARFALAPGYLLWAPSAPVCGAFGAGFGTRDESFSVPLRAV